MTISNDAKKTLISSVVLLALVAMGLLLIIGVFMLYQQAKVYSAERTGAAELARATQNRQVAVLDAQAQVERARGIAQANSIIANGLGGPEGYLRFLGIEALKEQKCSIAYIATEGMIPITEAGRVPNLTE